MRFVFELSKEHPNAPTDEILACLNAQHVSFFVEESTPDFLIVDIPLASVKEIAQRLAFTYSISQYIGICPPKKQDIQDCLENQTLRFTGSIAVTYRNRSHTVASQPLIQTIAEYFTQENTVNLQHPDHEIRVIITDKWVIIGDVLQHISRTAFEQRKVQHRPFFSPISLHPKWARLFVNLSQVAQGETLLDPFCGTGGFLLEAGLIGVRIIGSDIEQKMIEGCKKTLDQYNLKALSLIQCDIQDLPLHIEQVDVVVTDLPYGKSTTTHGESVHELTKRTFESLQKVVKPSGKIIMGLHDETLINVGKKIFQLETVYVQPVHRSLTRYFPVFTRKP